MNTERAKRLATALLTSSDRITKAMRVDAFELLEEIKVSEELEVVTFDIAQGQVLTISNRHLARYRRLIDGNLYISAIKESRSDYGLALLEAKALCDAIKTKYPAIGVTG